jgi:AraC-like DNA-binding protein
MDFRFDKIKIEELMKSFYTLTGIRFVLFDAEFNEIAFFPEEKGSFCRLMNSAKKTGSKCRRSNRRAFLKCSQEDSPVIYKCHAGLVEAVIPLHENEKITGYLMFGQITDKPDKSALYEKLDYWENDCGIDRDKLKNSISEIRCKTEQEILAAANIMEACTSYIIYKELIIPENSKLINAAKAYIDAHLSEDIQIEALCAELKIGRTKLYEIFKNELNIGVSKYILKRRMHRAKKLLKTTDLSITEISHSVGFSDYNYFSKVFKKIYGRSPKSYRK